MRDTIERLPRSKHTKEHKGGRPVIKMLTAWLDHPSILWGAAESREGKGNGGPASDRLLAFSRDPLTPPSGLPPSRRVGGQSSRLSRRDDGDSRMRLWQSWVFERVISLVL